MQAASERKALPSHLDGDQMDAPFRWGELFIKDGKLARYIGCKPSKDRPEVELIYQQTTIRLESCGEDDPVIARIIGQVLQSENGEVYSGYGGYTRVDVRGAKLTKVTVPVLKPRDGKEYTWRWTGQDPYSTAKLYRGYWIKEDFPRCSDCGRYHDPYFTYCEDCNRCHKAGGKCKAA